MLTEVIATTEGIAAWATPATGPISFATISALMPSPASVLSSAVVLADAEEVSVSADPTAV